MLLDSNIIIYASLPEYADLRQFIALHSPKVSAISHLEVLGYNKLTLDEKKHFEDFFQVASIIPVSNSVIRQAISLRQERKMSLGDSIIAATSIENNLKLVTRNLKDFSWIPTLSLLDPVQNIES
jgi:predicted nucleic acid-binding protein